MKAKSAKPISGTRFLGLMRDLVAKVRADVDRDIAKLILSACDLNSPVPEKAKLCEEIEVFGRAIQVPFRSGDPKQTTDEAKEKAARQHWRRNIHTWITKARECMDSPLVLETNNKTQRSRLRKAIERLSQSEATVWNLRVERDGKTRVVVVEGDKNDTANQLTLQAFFSVNDKGDGNSNAVGELVTLFTQAADRNGSVFSREFYSYSELTQTIQKLVERVRWENDRSRLITAAMHVRCEGQTEAEAESIALETSQGRFDEYANGLRDKSGKSCFLFSETTDRLLRHRFLCEAIGESRHPGAVFHPVISRVWTTVSTPRIGDEFEDQIASVIRDSGDRAHIEISVDPRSVPIPDFSRRLAWAVEEATGPAAIVLHWQCNSERTVDLLRPIDESLWRLMGFFRRSSFKGKPDARYADIGHCLRAVAKGALSDTEFDELRDTMVALLAGGPEPDAFVHIGDSIAKVLAHFEQHSPLHIVIEDAGFADELLVEIVQNLQGAMGSREFHVYWIERTDAQQYHEEITLDSEQYEKGYVEFLQLAAYLGFDFRLSWLEDCWEKLIRHTDELEHFLDKALQEGLLQFSDSLVVKACDEGEEFGYKLCRQLRWVSSDTHAMYVKQLEAGRQRAFEDAFYRSVAVDDDSKPIPISDLRLRTRIFDLLRAQSVLDSPKCDQVAGLGYFLGRRVARCGERREARRRLGEAIKAWEQGSRDSDLGRKLAFEQVDLWTSSRHVPSERGKPELAFARKRLKDCLDYGELNEQNRLEWFELTRMVCSAEIWAGDLRNAEKDAELLHEIAGDYEGPVFESWHLHAVASFALGKLEQCRDSALKGIEFCERHRTMALSYPRLNLYGNHDGRVCAKVFLGLSEFLMFGTDASERLGKACEFAKTEGTPAVAKESQCVAGSYYGIFHLLNEDFGKVEEVCESLHVIDPDHKQWSLVAELTGDCAAIAQTFVSGLRADLYEQISKHRAEWRINEYDTLWLTFAGVADYCRCGDFRAAQRSFDEGLSIADSTGQCVFLPLLYLWRSRVAARAELSEIANESLKSGIAIAQRMGANHYLNLLRANTLQAND